MCFEISDRGVVTFYTPSQYIGMPIPLCWWHMLLVSANFIGWKWDPYVVFICISLIASDVETVYLIVIQR